MPQSVDTSSGSAPGAGADPPLDRRPHRAEVRERILHAALEVFAERGYERSSLDQVARRARFTKGAVYSNFSSKEALFWALMERQVDARVERVRELAASGEGITAHGIGRQLAKAAEEDGRWQLIFMEYWARAVRDAEVRERFVAHRRALREALTEVVAQLSLPGSSRSPEELATLALALSNGYAIEALADPEGVDADLLGRTWEALVGDGAS